MKRAFYPVTLQGLMLLGLVNKRPFEASYSRLMKYFTLTVLNMDFPYSYKLISAGKRRIVNKCKPVFV